MCRIIVLALVVANLVSTLRADEAEDQVIAIVQKLGGCIAHDDTVPSKPIVTVDLSNTKATDTHMKKLAGLKSLTSLDLTGTKVTDAGLKELAASKKLTSLSLKNTQITDAGLTEFRQMLPNCKITK